MHARTMTKGRDVPWRDAQTPTEMVRLFIEEHGLTKHGGLKEFGGRLGIGGARPDNTVRRWLATGKCETSALFMRRALNDLEREYQQSV